MLKHVTQSYQSKWIKKVVQTYTVLPQDMSLTRIESIYPLLINYSQMRVQTFTLIDLPKRIIIRNNAAYSFTPNLRRPNKCSTHYEHQFKACSKAMSVLSVFGLKHFLKRWVRLLVISKNMCARLWRIVLVAFLFFFQCKLPEHAQF